MGQNKIGGDQGKLRVQLYQQIHFMFAKAIVWYACM